MKTKLPRTGIPLKTLSALLIFGVAGLSQSHGAVLAYESFGDAVGGEALDGYSGTDGVTENGLTGAWSATNDASVTQMKVRSEAWSGIDGGYSVNEDGDGTNYWVEQENTWNLTTATRSLSSNIDLTTDGTYYMSYFSRSGGDDVVLQLGLTDGTNELMWGNGYNRGVTSYYGALGANAADANEDGTRISIANWWDSVFWVAKLEKTNSDTTDDLAVSIQYYDLGADNTIDNGDPAVWTRTLALTGVDSTFDTLQMKIDGGGGQWPGMDELRVGESWMDATGVIPEPSTYALLLGAGALTMITVRRRKGQHSGKDSL